MTKTCNLNEFKTDYITMVPIKWSCYGLGYDTYYADNMPICNT